MPDASLPPTVGEVSIGHGRFAATVVRVAAGLREVTVDGRPLLDGFAPAEPAAGGRGQTLVPWPNRVAGGRYTFDGRAQQLALTEPARQGAIHGLARWSVWDVAELTPAAATLTTLVPPQPGWPTVLAVAVRYALDDTGLSVTTTARNVGAAACPYGTGHHPYLVCGTARADDTVLQVPAAEWLPTDARGVPTGRRDVDADRDFRVPRRVGGQVLDTAFTALDVDAAGRWRVRLTGPDGADPVSLWAGPAYRWVQVFTGDTLPDPLRRRGIAVEPMTCPPDAFNSGQGVARLEPGQQHVAEWGLSPA